ncbi:serine/threonine-protein kinase [Thermomonospora umbrina]|uniref:non-specific serine/threonine protein kinase n=1 Tax=Thermomonospora umbrina TaxID=111806 RepID=A0A3D9SRH3_9ACTN|nr:serine/threonine-protein kinase [Thermomonospora umbrina]REE98532.1 serine/threonine protein kinase [Thermomonospora umbrina]
MAQGRQGHLLGNRYRLDTVVGRGGMGTVWQAYDTMLDREVAVKEVLLPPGLSPADRDVLYERTFREARASARLNHPSVVTVHDVINESGRPWLVMEFVRARSLQDLIDQGRVPPRRAAEIGRQTLEALRHAHGKGILHRDVKPSNVLITDIDADRGFRAVLTDFGIAQVEGDATLTQTGLVMGSPAYIPPERAQGERAVPASDLWALGATLYAAVEGRSPYERSDAMASLAAALSEPVPPPRNAGPLRDVLMGLLAREPRHRMTADQALPKLVEAARAPEARPAPPVREFPTALDETKLDEPFERPRRSPARYAPPPPPVEVSDTVLDSTEVETVTREDTGSAHRPTGGRGGADSEARTVVQTDWTPPPPRPYTPATWQQQPPQTAGRPGSPQDRYERERTKTIAIVTVAVILVVVAVLAGAIILRMQMKP